MQKSVLNKERKFGVKILWRYTDMAIFVLRCFILTHPVVVNRMTIYVTLCLAILQVIPSVCLFVCNRRAPRC